MLGRSSSLFADKERSRSAGRSGLGSGNTLRRWASTVALAKSPDSRVWAKQRRALHTGDPRSHPTLPAACAEDPPERKRAEGLEAVARSAERAGDGKRLEAAVIGLGAIAPDRSVGACLDLIRRPVHNQRSRRRASWCHCLAPDAETVDSLLPSTRSRFGDDGCDTGTPLFQAALRRTKSAELHSRAEEGVAGCSLALGIRAEAGEKLQDATLWYAAAIRIDSSTTVGRRALVGYGDARLKLGDTIAAALAFQAVASDRVQSDSIRQMADDRLSELRGRSYTRDTLH